MKKLPEIKILDNGFNRFQTQCFGCGCVFEYDIKNIDYGKGKSFQGYVRCPICGHWHEHKLKENVRREDVLAKYKDEIKKELAPKITKDIIECIGWCIRDRSYFCEEDGFDYEMIAKWWEEASPVLSERYQYHEYQGSYRKF